RKLERIEPGLSSSPSGLEEPAELGLSAADASSEAARCLACGCGEGCSRCVTVCLYSAITADDGRVCVDPEKCDGCGLCVEICPNRNIELVHRQSSDVKGD
ncbi:MAG TPA: hypothetical protein ENN09_06490, partial [Planctomycetes bacterium]|nr:hypothetical protein [Planctomycetota bacterium]